MQVITTRRDGSAIAKPFSWSYSRLKNFEVCPKRHWHIDVKKDAKEDEESEALVWGDTVHKGAAKRLSTKQPLPQGLELLEPWCQRIEHGAGTILVEQKLAIASDFGKCGYFDKGDRPTWLRVVVDALKLAGPVALAIDWKTGKILEDSVQLALTAQCVFAHYPDVQRIRTEFIWLKEDATTRADFARSDMAELWRQVLPRVDALKLAHDTTSYPPRPGKLCRSWCPVKQCPHYGERN
jgi:hypothetical protein